MFVITVLLLIILIICYTKCNKKEYIEDKPIIPEDKPVIPKKNKKVNEQAEFIKKNKRLFGGRLTNQKINDIVDYTTEEVNYYEPVDEKMGIDNQLLNREKFNTRKIKESIENHIRFGADDLKEDEEFYDDSPSFFNSSRRISQY